MTNVTGEGYGIPGKSLFREFTIGGVTFLAQASAVEPHDASTGALMVIDYAHHEIHAGSSFAYNDVVTLGSGAAQDYLLTVPDTAKWPHLGYEIDGLYGVTLELFEATDKSGTTIQTAYNRNSAVTPTMTIHKGTSGGTTDGTRIAWRKSGSGTSAGKLAATVHDTDERMLKRDTKYILRITSAAASNDVSVRFDWYEHTDKE